METLGYITAIIVVIFLCGWGIAVISALIPRKKNPKLAGTAIPQLGEGLDISKRYDIVYSGGDHGSQVVERIQHIKIVGYVGKDNDESVDKMYMRSRWLVVEFVDGRKGYLMPHAIVSLMESAEK